MLYIGDCHGECRPQYLDLIKSRSPKLSIQVGDLALGFPGAPDLEVVEGARFIRGNHDNPPECQKHPNFLGDFGFWESEGIFYISGARSNDWNNRIPGYTCWEGEELNQRQWHECIDLYKSILPRKVVSHDCPKSVCKKFWGFGDNSTTHGLQILLDIHKPELWVFGHHHKTKKEIIDRTYFVCLGCQFEEFENEQGEITWRQTGFDTFED